MNILAIIPARSGSKSIIHKNIKNFLGKPLIAHSIEHALKSKLINRVIVSTDSNEYAEVAKKYGAEVPFLRPDLISLDSSNDYEFVLHALNWFLENENYKPDICVQLRPTHPIRNIDDIDKMIMMLMNSPEADSVRSVVENKTIIPYKMWFLDSHNELKPILNLENVREPYNTPRQMLPKTYFQNASVDVFRTECVLNKRSLSGDKLLGFVMEEQFDIDYEEDFIKAERVQLFREFDYISGKKFCFDIDGVIATLVKDNNYADAGPRESTIDKINKLFDQGNKIVLFTARGYETGINWEEITKTQMMEWGVKYHEIYFGKPSADYYIDDKAINILDFS